MYKSYTILSREEMKSITAGNISEGCNGKTCEITSGCFDGGTAFSWCKGIPSSPNQGKCEGGFCTP